MSNASQSGQEKLLASGAGLSCVRHQPASDESECDVTVSLPDGMQH